MGYGNELASCDQTIPMIRRATITERLADRKERLTAELAEVPKALDALTKNPELQQLLDIVSKVS